MQGYRGPILDSQGRLPKEMIFKQRKENEAGSHVTVNDVHILGQVFKHRGNSRRTGPEVGIMLWCV